MNRTDIGVAAAGIAAAGLAGLALVLAVGATHRHDASRSANALSAGQLASAPAYGSAPVNAPTPVDAPARTHGSTAAARSTFAAQPQPPSGPFRLLIRTAAVTIDVPVAPFSVVSYEVVDPPHATAQQWDTAAWIAQSTYPAHPRAGTAYIYGHACQYIVCAFNDLKDARVGDIAQITTRGGVLTYQVDRIGLGLKTAGTLPDWAADSAVPNRIVLVTCAYEVDGSSPDNLIVVARLVH